MPVAMNAAPSDSPVGQQKKGTADQVAQIPFARASKWHLEQGPTQSGVTINTATPGTFNFSIPSYGYLSCVVLTIAGVGGSGTAAVFSEDAPWSIISNIMLQDVNGVPIWGPFSGYSAYLASKFGGYRLFPPDPIVYAPGSYTSGTANPNPSLGQALVYGPALTTPGNTPLFNVYNSGNFIFTLPIWQEFGRDGLGCLPNMDASARYNLQVTIANATASAAGPVYTTAPTGYPTVTITVEAWFRSQPPAQDIYGNANTIAPPSVGTVNYWSQQTFSSLSGAQTLQLSRVGNLIRNHILVFRDPSANQPRSTAESTDMPNGTLEMDWDVGVRYVGNIATIRQWYQQSYGFGPPNGVIALANTIDPDKLALSEFGDEWMATVGATKLTLRFTPLATVNLTVLTNDLVPGSPQVYAAPSLQGAY